jgi:hypothetical protein
LGKKNHLIRQVALFLGLLISIISSILYLRILFYQKELSRYKSAPSCETSIQCRQITKATVLDTNVIINPSVPKERNIGSSGNLTSRHFVTITYLDKTEKIEFVVTNDVVGRVVNIPIDIETWEGKVTILYWGNNNQSNVLELLSNHSDRKPVFTVNHPEIALQNAKSALMNFISVILCLSMVLGMLYLIGK